MNKLVMAPRIKKLKEKMLCDKRYASIEQALIITETYKQNEDKSVVIKKIISIKKFFFEVRN